MVTAEQARRISYVAELDRVCKAIEEAAREEKYSTYIIIHNKNIINELWHSGYIVKDAGDSEYWVIWRDDESNSCGK